MDPIRRVTVRVPYIINTLPLRKARADTRQAKLVLQGEASLTSAREALPMLRTGGFNSCVVLVLYSRAQRSGALAHFDLKTAVETSLSDLILPEFERRGGRDLRARLLGGMAGASEGLARELRSALLNHSIKIIGVDLFRSSGYPGLILDTRDGKLFDLAGRTLPLTAEEAVRQEESLRYLTEATAPRPIRLVI